MRSVVSRLDLRAPRRSALAAMVALAAAGTASAAFAADGRTYDAVTPAIFDCVKTTSSAEHGTVYESADGLSGMAVTASSLYTVRLDFTFDPAAGSLAYTLVSKTFIVPASAVWSGIEDALNRCR
ncbi:MAG: hypothetical protein KIT43_15405 [Bauldia sp.]|nr:hypothetical protein [Bauldia sp.]